MFKRNVTHNVRRLEFLEVSLYQPHRSEEWNILKSFIVKHTQELAKNKSENKYTIQSKKKKIQIQIQIHGKATGQNTFTRSIT